MVTFSQNELAAKLADSLSPLAILEGKTIIDVASSFFGNTEAGNAVRRLLKQPEDN